MLCFSLLYVIVLTSNVYDACVCFVCVSVCVCVSVLFICIAEHKWACLTWKSATEIKSLLLLSFISHVTTSYINVWDMIFIYNSTSVLFIYDFSHINTSPEMTFEAILSYMSVIWIYIIWSTTAFMKIPSVKASVNLFIKHLSREQSCWPKIFFSRRRRAEIKDRYPLSH